MSKMKQGKDLKRGDTLKVWWGSNTRRPNEDTIIEISWPDDTTAGWQRMSKIFKQGYVFAHFLSGVSMTIDRGDYYELA